MAQISFSDIEFSYDGSQETVFKNFSISFDSSWRLGLVARNGRGKTTLLKLLAGQEHPNRGTIHLPHNIIPMMFPPALEYSSGDITKSAVIQSIPDLKEWRFMRELSLLNVGPGLLDQPFCTLSPGEQGKVLLAALFANEENYVLLDEPGNHLDIDGKRILAKYLSGKPNFLLVSHERALLEAVTDHTMALLKSKPEIVAGSYHVWSEHRKNIESFERASNMRLSKQIVQLNDSARRSGQWAEKSHRDSTKDDGSGVKFGLKEKKRAKAAKLESRTKQIVRRKEQAAEEKEKLLNDIEENEPLKMNPLIFHSDQLLTASNLSLWYDNKLLLEKTSFLINLGDRVCLSGHNGAGKSTLLKMIAGNPVPEALHNEGSLHIPKGIKLSILPQICMLPDIMLMEWVQQKDMDTTKMLTLLRKMGFQRDMFRSKVSDLSAGQKRKLLLARSICEEAHLYLWDEPLNYLDIQTREQIEDVLLQTCPTLIFTEHDDYFCKKIATGYLFLPNDKVAVER